MLLSIFKICMAVLSVNGGADKLVFDIIDENNWSNICCFWPELLPPLPELFFFAPSAVTSLYALKNDLKTGNACYFA